MHSDSELQTASDYLEYHVRMYVETLLWLRNRIELEIPKDIVWNAMLEDHLVHARLLIHFISKSKDRNDDIFAVSYFHDTSNLFEPLRDDFLEDWAKKIGSHLVHLTTKPKPVLKSQQTWPIDDIASRLVPALKSFLYIVLETRLVDGAKNDCLKHLSKVLPPKISISTSAAT